MTGLRRFLLRFRASTVARHDDDRLREELEQHVRMQAEDNRRAGAPPHEAERRARLKLGSIEAIRDDYRREQRLLSVEHLWQDIRYFLRQLRRSPLFTAAAVFSIAIGIGANVAVFSVIDRLLLRPLPVLDPEELVFITDQRIREEASPRYSYPFYTRVRDSRILPVTARFVIGVTVDPPFASTDRARAELVSGSYFSVLGVGAEAGRVFTPADDLTPGGHPVVVIGDRFWRRALNAEPGVVGRTLRLNGHLFTIVGIAAEGFSGIDVGRPVDLWLPMMMQQQLGRDLIANTRTNWLEILGRLPLGTDAGRIAAELSQAVVAGDALEQGGLGGPREMVLHAGARGRSVDDEITRSLRTVALLTMLALVLACANVAGLLAVRATAREREMAIRLALGARRSHLMRQSLVETVVLTTIGGLAALMVTPMVSSILVAAQPRDLGLDTGVDLRTVLLAIVATVLTTVLIGAAPMLMSRKAALAHTRGGPDGRARRVRFAVHDVVVISQIAVCLAMLVSAALLVQSLRGLSAIDPGFKATDVLLASIDPKSAGYSNQRVAEFWTVVLERVSATGGVRHASVGRLAPLDPGSRQRQPVFDTRVGEFVELDANVVGPRYFATLDIPLLGGREFDVRDSAASRPVVIVNDVMARTFWPGQDAIGKTLHINDGPAERREHEVVGVVKDVKYRQLRDEIGPILYRAAFQTRSVDAMTLHVRAANDPEPVMSAIRREIRAVDPRLSLFGVTTLEAQLDAAFAQPRLAAAMTGAFGLIALVLSAVGVYGVTALAAKRQTRSIGIRMVLGARPRDIVRAVGRRSATIVAAGLGFGLLAAYALAHITGAMLVGVTPTDAVTFIAASSLLATVSLVAIYVPARSATKRDALRAIRSK